MRRNNRVIRIERRFKIGTTRRLKDALLESEDSETLNTSFVERLNLTIRQGSAYLRRRSPCHARCEDQLRGHVELLRCHYYFVRPHRALRFGRELRTPAMQAGLVTSGCPLATSSPHKGSRYVFLWRSCASQLPYISRNLTQSSCLSYSVRKEFSSLYIRLASPRRALHDFGEHEGPSYLHSA